MNQRLLLSWALGATLIAVGAVGYIAGKQAGQTAQPQRTASATEVTDPNAAVPAAPRYVVPEAFNGIATEWRSDVGTKARGYAALFDPVSRRLILERCQHHEYASPEAMAAQGDFCQPLASGRLASLDASEATLTDRSGNELTVGLEYDKSNAVPTLKMSFDGTTAKLIPGSRNDLIQAFEALPDVQDNKREYLTAMMAPRDNRYATPDAVTETDHQQE